MLVAVCYAELSTEVSYAGGTFVYACKLYGRGLGWCVLGLVVVCVAAARRGRRLETLFARTSSQRRPHHQPHAHAQTQTHTICRSVAVNVLCEYALGAATVSIGFSNYLATLW